MATFAARSGQLGAESALADAVRDGDRIHAVIRGSAINNDGSSSGSMGRPSIVGQRELVQSALADADVKPTDIGYVEADVLHGTGTRAGDGVEIGALAMALGEGRSEPLLVGSVKTNIGHTEAAAGAAGLIKTALSVRNGFIPPSLNVQTLNPAIAWDQIPVAVVREGTEWRSKARLAGVSGYGISGANAHVIVEAPPQPEADCAEAVMPILPLGPQRDGFACPGGGASIVAGFAKSPDTL